MAAFTGPVPNPNRVRRHKDALTPGMEIRPDGKLRGHALPKDFDWCDKTRAWWLTWRRSPQAQLMHDSDWGAMLEAALVHHAIWVTPGVLKSGELVALTKELHRMTEKYGLTYADRLRLRIKLVDEPHDREVGVTPLPPQAVPDNVVPMYRELVGRRKVSNA